MRHRYFGDHLTVRHTFEDGKHIDITQNSAYIVVAVDAEALSVTGLLMYPSAGDSLLIVA